MATRCGTTYAVGPLDHESPPQDGDRTIDMDAREGTSTDGMDQRTEGASINSYLSELMPLGLGLRFSPVEGHATSSVPASDTLQDMIDISCSGQTDAARDVTSRSGLADVARGYPSHSGITDVAGGDDLLLEDEASRSWNRSYADALANRSPSGRHSSPPKLIDTYDNDFISPRTTARAPSRAMSTIDTTPHFFAHWFDSEPQTEHAETELKSPRWSDIADDEDLGEIPAGWTIGAHAVQPQCEEHALHELLDEWTQDLSPEVKDLLTQRAEKLKNMRVVTAETVSETTDQVVENQPSRSKQKTSGSGGRENSQIPTSAKGKGRATTVPSVIEIIESDDEKNDDNVRLNQIRADALLARRLHEHLNRIQGDIDELKRTRDQQAGVAGPSNIRRDTCSMEMKPNNTSAPKASSQLPKTTTLYKLMQMDKKSPSYSSSSPSSSSSSGNDDSGLNLAGDSDWSSFGSEPSDPGSADSADTKNKKKSAKRKWKTKMMKLRFEQSNAKVDPPFVYNGEPNYTLYQKWILEAKDWLKLSFIRHKNRVACLKKYLSGRAHSFYMRDVARCPSNWTLARFLEALFDHCFLTNFREIQREKYFAFSQRGHPIRNYRRDLEELADSVGHIAKCDFTIRFWHGADQYLRVRWAEIGLDPETASTDQLERAAERFERALKLSHAEGRGYQRDRDQHPPRYSSSNDAHRGQRSNPDDRKPAFGKGKTDVRKPRWPNTNQPPAKKSQLSKEQMNEYHAQGKCFECGEAGHIGKNCPKKCTARPPASLRAATVDFSEIRRLDALRAADSLGLMSIEFTNRTHNPELEAAMDDVLVAHTLDTLRNAVPFVFDYFHDPNNSPYSATRFQLDRWSLTEFILWDWHTCDSHIISRADLLSGDFNIAAWLYDEKAKIEDQLLTGYPDNHLPRPPSPSPSRIWQLCHGDEPEHEEITTA
ncbi:hypothetical protein EVG20_g10362 [Dentipellis fragilis]|uniref:CCHC-type domain-containing protein n=1 Tax=Dentipellis fragilis TaxID=205917 RepID=A0A4Y9XU16_9AGAM|nr:hypothetical protein EVG20_g10362 [Dentipellis fragilis]